MTRASVHMVINVSVNRLYVCLACTCVSDSWALPCPLDFVIEIEIVKPTINLVTCSCKSMNFYLRYIPVSHFHVLVCFIIVAGEYCIAYTLSEASLEGGQGPEGSVVP